MRSFFLYLRSWLSEDSTANRFIYTLVQWRFSFKESILNLKLFIVYSKWSCAFLRPTVEWMHVCTRKYLFCFKNPLIWPQFSCNYAIFCWMCFRRTDKTKTSIYGSNMLLGSIIVFELTNSSATQNHVVFQPTSEQDKYGAPGILTRNSKAFAVFLWG